MDINDIKEDYEYLVPSKDEGLVVFMLNEKIEKKEIGKEFTYQDIQDIIRIVSNLIDPAHQRQTERILKQYTLLTFLILKRISPCRLVLLMKTIMKYLVAQGKHILQYYFSELVVYPKFRTKIDLASDL